MFKKFEFRQNFGTDSSSTFLGQSILPPFYASSCVSTPPLPFFTLLPSMLRTPPRAKHLLLSPTWNSRGCFAWGFPSKGAKLPVPCTLHCFAAPFPIPLRSRGKKQPSLTPSEVTLASSPSSPSEARGRTGVLPSLTPNPGEARVRGLGTGGKRGASPVLQEKGTQGISFGRGRKIKKAEEARTKIEQEKGVSKILKQEEYLLDTFKRSNQDTCLTHKPNVIEGSWVQSGELLTDCASSVGGELSLGQNLLIAYMPWEGYNFEDAILISERLVMDDLYTSIHIERYELETQKTKLGTEEITRDIPDVIEQEIAHLDSFGVVKLGSWVEEGDILVGKTTPINKKKISPYQKLLYSILEKQVRPIKDSSLRAPKGIKAKVIDIKYFFKSPPLLTPDRVKSDTKPRSFTPGGFAPSEGNPLTPSSFLQKDGSGGVSPLFPKGKAVQRKRGKREGSRETVVKQRFPAGRRALTPPFLLRRPSVGNPLTFSPSPLSSSGTEMEQKGLLLGEPPASPLLPPTSPNPFPSPFGGRGRSKGKGCLSFPRRGTDGQGDRGVDSLRYKKFIKKLNLLFTKIIYSSFNLRFILLSSFFWPSLGQKRAQASLYKLANKKPNIKQKEKVQKAVLTKDRPIQTTTPSVLFKKPLFPFRSYLERVGEAKLHLPISSGTKENWKSFTPSTNSFLSFQRNPLAPFYQKENFAWGKMERKRAKITIKNIETIHIYLAEKRKIQVGDKMAGRHGNKGIVSQILPIQDMPFLPDGTPVDMVLNPLGVPSRMNVGQIYECLLGFAGKFLGENYKVYAFDEIYGPEASRSFVFNKLYEASTKTGFQWLFDPNSPGKIRLCDGRNGEFFDQKVTVGLAYMLRLVHMVDDKIHCLTPEHEVLTSQGWLPIGEITLHHQVATLNKTGELVYQKPNKVFHYHNYKGSLYHIQNKNLDLVVTLNHRMFVTNVSTASSLPLDCFTVSPTGALLKRVSPGESVRSYHVRVRDGVREASERVRDKAGKKEAFSSLPNGRAICREKQWVRSNYHLIQARDIIGHCCRYLKNANWIKEDYQFILPSLKSKGTIEFIPDKKVNMEAMEAWLLVFGLWMAEGWSSLADLQLPFRTKVASLPPRGGTKYLHPFPSVGNLCLSSPCLSFPNPCFSPNPGEARVSGRVRDRSRGCFSCFASVPSRPPYKNGGEVEESRGKTGTGLGLPLPQRGQGSGTGREGLLRNQPLNEVGDVRKELYKRGDVVPSDLIDVSFDLVNVPLNLSKKGLNLSESAYQVQFCQFKKCFLPILAKAVTKLGYNYRIIDNKLTIFNKQLWSYFKSLSIEEPLNPIIEIEGGETEKKTISKEKITRVTKKTLPSWVWQLSQKQAQLLLHSMCLGDGTWTTRSVNYYTSSEKLADDVMRLALHAGWSANKYLYTPPLPRLSRPVRPSTPYPCFARVRGKGRISTGSFFESKGKKVGKRSPFYGKGSGVGSVKKKRTLNLHIQNDVRKKQKPQYEYVLWRVSIIKNNNNPVVNNIHHQKQKSQVLYRVKQREEVIPYEGSVYCLNVPNEVFYVRRNGIPVWTGNSRSTGPYSLVTQQPLRGRSKQGGQRLGEMEVWALEGYGAAFTLLEMLTIKSDDMTGRMTLWSNLILNKDISIGTPESFKVLICELQALCLDIGLYRSETVKNQMNGQKENLREIQNLMNLP